MDENDSQKALREVILESLRRIREPSPVLDKLAADLADDLIRNGYRWNEP